MMGKLQLQLSSSTSVTVSLVPGGFNLNGTIHDEYTGLAVPNAVIQVFYAGRLVSVGNSESDGSFGFEDLGDGTYRIIIAYDEVSVERTVTINGDTSLEIGFPVTRIAVFSSPAVPQSSAAPQVLQRSASYASTFSWWDIPVKDRYEPNLVLLDAPATVWNWGGILEEAEYRNQFIQRNPIEDIKCNEIVGIKELYDSLIKERETIINRWYFQTKWISSVELYLDLIETKKYDAINSAVTKLALGIAWKPLSIAFGVWGLMQDVPAAWRTVAEALDRLNQVPFDVLASHNLTNAERTIARVLNSFGANDADAPNSACFRLLGTLLGRWNHYEK
jgi:hypothetical protein